MTTPDKILQHLLDGPDITNHIAQAVRVPMLVALAMLKRLEIAKHVYREKTEAESIWTITGAGMDAARNLNKELSLL